MQQKTAVVLLSGGIDSTTCLAIALEQGYICHALSFDYGQKKRYELEAARRIAQHYNVVHRIVPLVLDFGDSALTNANVAVPDHSDSDVIPSTYVPARNTIFLSIALGYAEIHQSQDIFIGVNAVDYNHYPDCRPAYIAAFEQMANLATKAGVNDDRLTLHTPIIDLPKSDIIQLGINLGVDYSMTTSCYQPDAKGHACGHCGSCVLRQQGFVDAGVVDPTAYTTSS